MDKRLIATSLISLSLISCNSSPKFPEVEETVYGVEVKYYTINERSNDIPKRESLINVLNDYGLKKTREEFKTKGEKAEVYTSSDITNPEEQKQALKQRAIEIANLIKKADQRKGTVTNYFNYEFLTKEQAEELKEVFKKYGLEAKTTVIVFTKGKD